MMTLPDDHAQVLTRITDRVSADPRLLALGIGGSILGGHVDEYSDLDLIVVVADDHHAEVMADRQRLAASYGKLLASFTGEHVGEPRLLVCLYDDPLLHVDLKFVRADELAVRIEDPEIVWERGQTMTDALDRSTAVPLSADPQWIEDRFWVWIHYAATKLGRGELFEVIDFLAFARGQALAPLAWRARGLEPRGVRKLELRLPELTDDFARTVASYDAGSCGAAILATIELYLQLRDQLTHPLERREDVERASRDYLTRVLQDQPR